MESYKPESSVNADWSNQSKARNFQSLDVGDTYKVNGFKPITTKFGKTYILLVNHIVSDIDLELFAPTMLINYIDSGVATKGGFTFQVKYDKYSKYKHAV